eukprot:3226278-Amphidinium_carterae.1
MSCLKVMLTQSSTVEVRNVRAPCVWSIGEKMNSLARVEGYSQWTCLSGSVDIECHRDPISL